MNDVLIIGAGIIGVSLALELQRRGASVRVLDRGEPGREASYSSAGMLAAKDPETPEVLREILKASAEIYPDWIAKLEEESGLTVDLRREGTFYFASSQILSLERLPSEELNHREPGARPSEWIYFSDEGSVDPRALMHAALAAAKNRGIQISHEHAVAGVETSDGKVTGVGVGNRVESANVVVNCAGAWAQKITGASTPAHPVKGQMLSVVDPHRSEPHLKHVIRGEHVYLVPRSDGRILIGATVEKVGFDKRVIPEVILGMQHEAAKLFPHIAEMRIHESWAGLRPGSPDKLPLLGETSVRGYFAATGHYRNGVLLAPITARIMANLISGEPAGCDVSRFDPKRFA
jgi:glycine oxidase ThiO